MTNTKTNTPRLGLVGILATAFAACLLIFLPACQNPAQPEEGRGTLSLNVGGPGAARTIQPDASPADFARLDLNFTNAGNGTELDTITWTNRLAGSVVLPAGTWNLTVTAFDGAGHPVARGWLSDISVAANGRAEGSVALSPFGGGQGTFSWNIDLSGISNLATAGMEITGVGMREVTVAMWSNWSGGWDNNAALRINVNGTDLSPNARLAGSVGPAFHTFTVQAGDFVRFYWVNGGDSDHECAFAVWYSDTPPSPAFNPSVTVPVNDPQGRLLAYRQHGTAGAIGNGTPVGSFTAGTISQTVNLRAAGQNPGSRTLPTGQYRVVFELSNSAGHRASLSEILHVYRGLESGFAAEFTNEHFRVSLLENVLRAWTGSRWDFAAAGIGPAHFAILGIVGMEAARFEDAERRLNAPDLATLAGGVVDLPVLKALVDAKLISAASGDSAILNATYTNMIQAEAVISAAAGNGTELVFDWTTRSAVTVTVPVGSSGIGFNFVFQHPVPGFLVSFDALGGAPVPPVQEVLIRHTANRPAHPARPGFGFGGWYTDNGVFENRVDFGTPVTADTMLYAMWRPLRTVNLGDGITMDMERIAPGTFTRGQVGVATPVHEVTLTRGFYMGIHPVTQEQFQRVMGVNPSFFSTNPAPGEVQARRPVEMVNWYHAIAFANRLSILQGLEPVYSIAGMSNTNADAWLFANVPTSNNATWNAVTANWNANGFRLATEAEWEFAARAGTTTQWSFGNTDADIDYYAWIHRNAGGRTREVGLLRPNALGLYDMHGNVLEWVWDRLGSYSALAQIDPKGPAAGDVRVRRGGSWDSTPGHVRSAIRSDFFPDFRDLNLGFRVVRL